MTKLSNDCLVELLTNTRGCAGLSFPWKQHHLTRDHVRKLSKQRPSIASIAVLDQSCNGCGTSLYILIRCRVKIS